MSVVDSPMHHCQRASGAAGRLKAITIRERRPLYYSKPDPGSTLSRNSQKNDAIPGRLSSPVMPTATKKF